MPKTKLTFKRYEKKYLLSAEGFEALWQQLEGHIEPDAYFNSTVCSIYYDTDDYSLIRHSIEKPTYKEKLRLRSYNVPTPDGKVFVELKKKYKGIVYKRRVGMTASQATEYLAGRAEAPKPSQVTKEIDWFMHATPCSPKVFLACDREAWVAKDLPDLRITFDRNIRWRETELDITVGSHGEPLIGKGDVLMEVKIPGAAPMWLARMFSELELWPITFSKYGTCYSQNILEKYISGVISSV